MAFSPYTAQAAARRSGCRSPATRRSREQMLDRSAAGRMARVAPYLRRARLQPAHANHAAQRRGSARRVELVAAAGLERDVPLVHDGVDVTFGFGDSVQALDAQHRRPAVAVHAAARARRRAESTSAASRSTATRLYRRHVRCARHRARRRRPASSCGTPKVGRLPRAARASDRRPARRARQGHDRHDGHGRRRRARRPADRRASTPRPGAVAWRVAHDRAARRAGRRQLERHAGRASAAARPSGRPAATIPRLGPRVLRHRQHLRHRAAAEADRQAGRYQRRALHELDARRSIPTRASSSGTSSISRTTSGISTGRSSGRSCGLPVLTADAHASRSPPARSVSTKASTRETGRVRVLARRGPAEHRDGDRSGDRREDASTPAVDPGDGRVKLVCPHGAGAKNFLPAVVQRRATQIVIVPLNEACMDVFPMPGGGERRGAVVGRQLGHPAAARQRRQVRPACRRSTSRRAKRCGRRASARRKRPACSPPPAAWCSRPRSTAFVRAYDVGERRAALGDSG